MKITKKLLTQKGFRQQIVIGTLLCLYIVLLQVFKIYSPITYFFGVPTPTTGITRAWLMFFRGDLLGALNKHPLFPLAIPYASSLYLYMTKRKCLYFIVAFLFALLYLVVYIYRMINHTIYS
ncbi:DUF2752 domain-containing protein [Erysipelothrix urinaevulpis]|uniref:DUF2752 domain-containing protein n=1 Tax=Erysipelothrix urinaevulpis TaxID=2683717 RepID=UPI001358A302|nr:DUF2752 domain-containing protein [Erysipelothrix urinaevulpis]